MLKSEELDAGPVCAGMRNARQWDQFMLHSGKIDGDPVYAVVGKATHEPSLCCSEKS